MDLKGTKTEENLLAAFAGESQARNRYTYFASQAKKEGYEQIAGFFTETARNEKEHAKLMAKFLGMIGDTAANLTEAAAGEHHEWTQMYRDFEKTAREEGFNEIADVFKGVAAIEEFHEKRYLNLLGRMKNDTVFKRDNTVRWHCRNCGHVYEGNIAPEKCPVCSHPRAYFEKLCGDD